MKTRAIKVVKRNKKVEAENTQAVAVPLKGEGKNRQTVAGAVGKWITERRRAASAERADFNNKLLEWKTV